MARRGKKTRRNADEKHRQWLLELTNIPTACGHEQWVVDWVRQWAQRRRGVIVRSDRYGNLVLRQRGARATGRPIYFTAHMDHPAFVVTRVLDGQTLEAEFRGGVDDRYFVGSPVALHRPARPTQHGTVRTLRPADRNHPFKRATVEFRRALAGCQAGDVLTWDTGKARIKSGRLLAPACDDLGGVAAALAAFDTLRRGPHNVRVLLTRAEECGFLGATGACSAATIPKNALLIALECSKSLADSPIGAGPIVRVGDRTSTFDPDLTHRLGRVAQHLGARDPGFRWQRRLMTGGTCEATAYCAFGHTAACLCLALGNYHNMNESTGRIDAETISLDDYHHLIRLLAAVGRRLNRTPGVSELRRRMDDLFTARKHLLT